VAQLEDAAVHADLATDEKAPTVEQCRDAAAKVIRSSFVATRPLFLDTTLPHGLWIDVSVSDGMLIYFDRSILDYHRDKACIAGRARGVHLYVE
jgi:hypothetical protein